MAARRRLVALGLGARARLGTLRMVPSTLSTLVMLVLLMPLRTGVLPLHRGVVAVIKCFPR
jgi:hypothetical protein